MVFFVAGRDEGLTGFVWWGGCGWLRGFVILRGCAGSKNQALRNGGPVDVEAICDTDFSGNGELKIIN